MYEMDFLPTISFNYLDCDCNVYLNNSTLLVKCQILRLKDPKQKNSFEKVTKLNRLIVFLPNFRRKSHL